MYVVHIDPPRAQSLHAYFSMFFNIGHADSRLKSAAGASHAVRPNLRSLPRRPSHGKMANAKKSPV